MEFCLFCEEEQLADFRFCSNCGKRNGKKVIEEQVKEKFFNKNLTLVAVYALFSIAFLLIVGLSEDTLENLLLWTVLFAVIDIAFAFIQPGVLRLFIPESLRLLPMASMVLICLGTGVSVTYLSNHLNLILFDEIISNYFYFEHLEYPLLVALLIIAVCPAIFEELAFRGFVYNNLQVISGEKAAVWGSTFLFALVHFSLLSMFWLIPFGLLLAHFRRRYNTIVYGIVGHFIHNATTVFIEHYSFEEFLVL